MTTLTVTVESEDPDNFADTLDHVTSMVRQGFTSGHDRNESARFAFETGYPVKDSGDTVTLQFATPEDAAVFRAWIDTERADNWRGTWQVESAS